MLQMLEETNEVVALSRFELLAVEFDFVEWTTTRIQNLTIRALDGFFKSAFGLRDGVREGEDDGSFVVFCHQTENFGSETSSDGTETEKCRRFDVFDDFEKGRETGS